MRLLNARPTQCSDPRLRCAALGATERTAVHRLVLCIQYGEDCIRGGVGPLSVSYLGTAKINEQFAENGGFERPFKQDSLSVAVLQSAWADGYDIGCLLMMMLDSKRKY